MSDLNVLESDSTSITLEWISPSPTGRNDTYYEVCYDTNFDFNGQVCDPLILVGKGDSKFQYTNKGLLSYTCYFIKVTTHNGVSVDAANADRREETIVGCTTEGGLFLIYCNNYRYKREQL